MNDSGDHDEVVNLRRLNDDLVRSLERCRVLLRDCRAKLAANSNEPDSDNEDDDEEEG